MPTTRSAVKKQGRGQSNINNKRHINELPVEVLSHIFVLCDRISNSKAAAFEDWSDLHFSCQLTIPAVCRQWRKVALDTTALWTRITLSDPVPYHLSALYLSRSGPTAPLDIEIDMMEPFWDNTEEGTLEECAQRARDAFTFIVDQGGVASRWRSFWIQTDIFQAHLAAIEFLQSNTMPALQSLEMLFAGPYEFDDEDEFTLSEAARSSPRLLFHKPPPLHLHTVKLDGVPNSYLFGHPSHPQLVGLTHLELVFLEKYPDLGHLRDMLAASPELMILGLALSPIDEPEFGSSLKLRNKQIPRIRLQKLQALSLRIMAPKWDLNLLKILDAPNVKSLRINVEDGEREKSYFQLLELLACSGDKKNPTPYFPALAHFSYNIICDPTEDLRLLLPAYPGLTSLALPAPGAPLKALLDKPWLAPNLARLRVVVEKTWELKKLVVARRKAALPLKTIEAEWLGFGRDIKAGDKKRIEEMVDLVIVHGIIDDRDRDPMSW